MNVVYKSTKQASHIRQAGLVGAALELAARRSPASITTTDLARAVGITQGAVFKHFASKEAIWLAVLDWAADTLMDRLQTATQQPPASQPHEPDGRASELPALRAVFMAHVDFVAAYPGVPRVIFQELQSPGDTALKVRVQNLMQRYRHLLMQLLQQALQHGAIAPNTNLSATAVLFIGAVQGLMMQAMIAGDLSNMARQASDVFAIFERGVLADSRSSDSPSLDF